MAKFGFVMAGVAFTMVPFVLTGLGPQGPRAIIAATRQDR